MCTVSRVVLVYRLEQEKTGNSCDTLGSEIFGRKKRLAGSRTVSAANGNVLAAKEAESVARQPLLRGLHGFRALGF